MANTFPRTLTAGESLSLGLSYPLYPASGGWALKWVLQGPIAVRVAVSGTANGDGFDLLLSADDSAKLVGSTAWEIWVSKGQERHRVDRGVLEVVQGIETVSEAERTLAALLAARLKLAAGAQAEVLINGEKVVFKRLMEVQNAIALFQAEIRQARGESPIGLVTIGFRRPGGTISGDPAGRIGDITAPLSEVNRFGELVP